MKEQLKEYSHKRWNPLIEEWVLVSPHRSKRPWQGQEEKKDQFKRPSHDPECYLCSGNTRSNGVKNEDYKDVFVFQNDFAALQEDTPEFNVSEGLLKASSETGICKVICFSPDHSKSLADMDVEGIEKVIQVWQKEYYELSALETINYIQIFENKGAVMGCSNPHPHGQIWAQSSLPNEIIKKDRSQKAYFETHQKSLLSDYISQELALNERILFQNEYFVVMIPFWAVWPYEAMIVPKYRQQDIGIMLEEERFAFAEAIQKLTNAYDQLFNCSFPYSAGIHQAPTNGESNEHWHWHMSFYPPLLRSASVKKFMVGYEMFAMPQRDITTEMAVDQLRKHIL